MYFRGFKSTILGIWIGLLKFTSKQCWIDPVKPHQTQEKWKEQEQNAFFSTMQTFFTP